MIVARQLAGPALEVMHERKGEKPKAKLLKTTLAHVSDLRFSFSVTLERNADGLSFYLLHAQERSRGESRTGSKHFNFDLI